MQHKFKVFYYQKKKIIAYIFHILSKYAKNVCTEEHNICVVPQTVLKTGA